MSRDREGDDLHAPHMERLIAKLKAPRAEQGSLATPPAGSSQDLAELLLGLAATAAPDDLAGDIDAARRLWRRAEDHFDEIDMRAHLAVVRSRLAHATSGHESHRFASQADEYFAEEGVERRQRYIDWLAPAAAPR
jgi:hypothetical protein